MTSTEGGCAVLVGMVAAWAALFTLGVVVSRALWNWIVPAVFHGPPLTFWQTAGLCFLLNIVGGAFRARQT